MITKAKQADSRFLLKRIGKRLKFYRLSKGFTQEELAERAGFTRSYYTEIETGKRNVSIVNLCRLSSALNVPLGELMDIPIDQEVALTRVVNS
ncbi:helix-turn-helix domain-containing protein [Radiobacillus sp. PE A8.2]|uniref:helix-turn-helix domain-containing protein n=1 Tax=Radiobacillus sp. PE A8.2 TaxID=3380349 RepID=UPI00389069E6